MPEKKQEIFAKYGKSNTDTGSPESQVALFSYRIAPFSVWSARGVSCWIISRRLTSRGTGISSRSLVSADKHIGSDTEKGWTTI